MIGQQRHIIIFCRILRCMIGECSGRHRLIGRQASLFHTNNHTEILTGHCRQVMDGHGCQTVGFINRHSRCFLCYCSRQEAEDGIVGTWFHHQWVPVPDNVTTTIVFLHDTWLFGISPLRYQEQFDLCPTLKGIGTAVAAGQTANAQHRTGLRFGLILGGVCMV